MPDRYHLAIALLAFSVSLQAAGPHVATIEGKVLADEPWTGNEAAMPVGLISDMMLVGTPGDGEAGSLAGAVWAFKRVGQQWVQTQKILPTNPENGMRFGWSLSVDEQVDSGEAWMAVGAPQFDNKGRVDMYKRVGDTWVYHSTLSIPDPSNGAILGEDVSINVDIPLDEEEYLWTVAMGARGYKHAANIFSTGAVFISNLNNLEEWSVPGLPLGDIPGVEAQNIQIGSSVALDGDVIVAGAPWKTVSGNGGAGTIYLYTRSPVGTWALQSTFDNPDPIVGQAAGGANFGKQVALAKQIVPETGPTGNYYYVVGASTSTTDHAGGQAYILDGSAGTVINSQRVFRPDQTTSGDFFGFDVAIAQDLVGGDHRVLISSRVSGNGTAGAVFMYNQSDLLEPWLASYRIVIADTAPQQPGFSANVGQGLAAWENWLAISATNGAANSDAVYTNPLVLFRNGFEP